MIVFSTFYKLSIKIINDAKQQGSGNALRMSSSGTELFAYLMSGSLVCAVSALLAEAQVFTALFNDTIRSFSAPAFWLLLTGWSIFCLYEGFCRQSEQALAICKINLGKK